MKNLRDFRITNLQENINKNFDHNLRSLVNRGICSFPNFRITHGEMISKTYTKSKKIRSFPPSRKVQNIDSYFAPLKQNLLLDYKLKIFLGTQTPHTTDLKLFSSEEAFLFSRMKSKTRGSSFSFDSP